MLDKKSILNSDDLPREEVHCELWQGSVWIRTMSGQERDEFESSCVSKKGKEMNLKNIRARLCVLCICNEKGQRLFDARDIEALGKKSSKMLDLCFSKAQELNGLSADAVDELAGN
tara:strand:+ start:1178 stop:1525 length:348 start_codon:yes stop_codon:yes gene_type:complete